MWTLNLSNGDHVTRTRTLASAEKGRITSDAEYGSHRPVNYEYRRTEDGANICFATLKAVDAGAMALSLRRR